MSSYRMTRKELEQAAIDCLAKAFKREEPIKTEVIIELRAQCSEADEEPWLAERCACGHERLMHEADITEDGGPYHGACCAVCDTGLRPTTRCDCEAWREPDDDGPDPLAHRDIGTQNRAFYRMMREHYE